MESQEEKRRRAGRGNGGRAPTCGTRGDLRIQEDGEPQAGQTQRKARRPFENGRPRQCLKSSQREMMGYPWEENNSKIFLKMG